MPFDADAGAARASEPLYAWWFSVLPRLFGVPVDAGRAGAGVDRDAASSAGDGTTAAGHDGAATHPFPVDLAQQALALAQGMIETLVGASLQALAERRPGDEAQALQGLVQARVAALADPVAALGRMLAGSNVAALGSALNGAPLAALGEALAPWSLNLERAYGGLADAFGLAPLRQLEQAVREASLATLAHRQAQLEYLEVVAGAAGQGAQALGARLAEMGRSGESVDSLLALVRLWARVTDEAMHRAMQAPRALEASAKLVRAATRARAGQQRVVAIVSAALDVPTRTELDDAYREIQELKRQLRRLRKGPLAGDAAAAGPPPAQAVTSAVAADARPAASRDTAVAGPQRSAPPVPRAPQAARPAKAPARRRRVKEGGEP